MENKKNKLSDWLERLQQESWQLELLISGFLLSMLLTAREYVNQSLCESNDLLIGNTEGAIVYFLMVVGFFTISILIINLICHVGLRSLWIGAIGLRNISGEIDLENIKLSPRFRTYLQKKLPTFDGFIEQLENICCLIFAFTFLIIFSILSFFIVIVISGFIVYTIVELLRKIPGAKEIIRYPILIFMIFYGLMGLLYMIDFVSLGKIKQIKWFSRFYMPFYRFFSAISLARVYRPLYYNMIDNKLGRRVMLFIIPYLGILSLISMITFNGVKYFPLHSSPNKISNYNYENLSDNKGKIDGITLSQKYYDEQDFMEIFVPLNIFVPKFKYKACANDLQKNEVGLKIDFLDGGDEDHNPSNVQQHDLALKYNLDSLATLKHKADLNQIQCLASHFEVYIADSLQQKVSYDFYKHPKSKQKGILATVDILSLKRGKYFLDFKVKDSTNAIMQRFTIPFWKR